MKLNFKKRKEKRNKAQKSAEKRTYQFTMPQDTEKVQLEAWTVASVKALDEYPDSVKRDRAEVEAFCADSLLVLQANTQYEQPLTNDFEAYSKVFVSNYADAYLETVHLYDADPAGYEGVLAERKKRTDAQWFAHMRAFLEKRLAAQKTLTT